MILNNEKGKYLRALHQILVFSLTLTRRVLFSPTGLEKQMLPL